MFAHTTVLLDEAVAALALCAGGVYVDGTFGRGGHSRRILQTDVARLIAFDKDPAAIAAAAEIKDARFEIVHDSFAQMQTALTERGVTAVDGVLLDLGISSPQIDDAQRGFSFRHDGPLDMRMDPTRGISAADWLAQVDVQELTEVIKDYGEERYAVSIAKALVARRLAKQAAQGGGASGPVAPCDSTGELAALVASVVRKKEPGQDPATRTFQAIRIHINRELAELPLGLNQAFDLLRPGGRLVVISFHSLEDRIVKRFMQQHAKPEAHLAVPRHLPLRADQLPQPQLRLLKRVHPGAQEVAGNPRARSAVMRVAEKLAPGASSR
ncbi:MAG: 16S rRNA (cytosine(1402)-N(4))-methyltransferase RsmH [Burkholderiaceae bacterium]|nr:MAG: 16S rRNA (cytosine(1402)-N(4))-methyltransferase RsmH [Burkholderiaceae bacterium]